MVKVAIQGGITSFHDMAARNYFTGNSIDILECQTFMDLCQAVVSRTANVGVMAIENSLVGSILPNYALLHEYHPLYIVGETYMRIEQNLMGIPGQSLSDIHLVRSHPMALHQCRNFLTNYPNMRILESFDTAESAKEIRQKELKGVAAIAGKAAAEQYQLEILAEGIENLKKNCTRFLILSRQNEAHSDTINKASIYFRVKHQVGALLEVLQVFRSNDVNLSKIQSIAIPEAPHEYGFLAELEKETEYDLKDTIQQVKPFCHGLKILGIYQKGVKPNGYSTSEPA